MIKCMQCTVEDALLRFYHHETENREIKFQIEYFFISDNTKLVNDSFPIVRIYLYRLMAFSISHLLIQINCMKQLYSGHKNFRKFMRTS